MFDKVEENTQGFEHTTRRTFAEHANLAINQTFMRSINTSLISIIPVVALMVVAVWLLGVGTLKDLALVHAGRRRVGTLLVDLLRHAAAGDAAGTHRARSHPHPPGAQPAQAGGREGPAARSEDAEWTAEPEAVVGVAAAQARGGRQAGTGRAPGPADRRQDRTAVG